MIIKYDRLPEHMQDGARLYIERGIEPGGFLTAVLENNLTAAFGRADGTNKLRMQDWVEWLYWDIPSPAWGSKEKVTQWIANRGMEGLDV